MAIKGRLRRDSPSGWPAKAKPSHAENGYLRPVRGMVSGPLRAEVGAVELRSTGQAKSLSLREGGMGWGAMPHKR
jgi:hypothetical protein